MINSEHESINFQFRKIYNSISFIFTYQYLCHSFVSPCFISHPFFVSNSGELLTRSSPQPSGVPRLSDGDGDNDSVEDMLSFFCKLCWLRLFCKADKPRNEWEDPLDGGVVFIVFPLPVRATAEPPEAEGRRRWAAAAAVATSSLLKYVDLEDRYSLLKVGRWYEPLRVWGGVVLKVS